MSVDYLSLSHPRAGGNQHHISMDINLERDGTAIGSLFQQIISDMKVSADVFSVNIFNVLKCLYQMEIEIVSDGVYLYKPYIWYKLVC